MSLKSQGFNIISFGVGEPDYDTPDNVKMAAIKAIADGHTKYTNADGTLELKTAIKNKLKKENNLDYDTQEIIVSCGAKHTIYNLFVATLNEGDEVIIPTPYWVSYPEMVTLCGGAPIIAKANEQLKLTPEELEAKISPRTKWLMINCPSNPSGVCYSKQELKALADVLEKYPHVHIMSDDIYEHIMFDKEQFCNIAQVAPALRERIFIVNGVSKSHAMTGWRIGYGAGNKAIVKGMAMVQSQSTSNPCSISQMAAIQALEGPQEFVLINKVLFEHKRDMALEILKRTPLLKLVKPQGAFYLFIDCRQAIGLKSPSGTIVKSCDDFATYLLENAKVAVVQGEAFGMPGFFRMSFATSVENIMAGCNAIVNACQLLT
jgi:aspartate aminotransferase